MGTMRDSLVQRFERERRRTHVCCFEIGRTSKQNEEEKDNKHRTIKSRPFLPVIRELPSYVHTQSMVPASTMGAYFHSR